MLPMVAAAVISSAVSAGANKLFSGSPEKHRQISTLRKEQEPLYKQSVNAAMNPGAGGAFGTSADYYRNLLSDNPEDFNAFAAPEMRRYNEQIIPGLAEQFAGMGAGGLSSSGFRNAAVGAGTDLSERLGAIRAQLRQQGAQGLFNIGQQGLSNYSQDRMTEQGTPGFLSNVSPAIGNALGQWGSNYVSQMGQNSATPNTAPTTMPGRNSFGSPPVSQNTSPFGGNATSGRYNLPTYLGR